VLKDVVVTPDGGAWAVGWSVHEGGVSVPLIERWDGSRWSTVSAPGRGLLSGVALLPGGDAIAVGWQQTTDDDRTLTLSFDRGSWKTAAGTGDPGRLASVAAGEAVVAVGMRFDDTGVPQALAARWDDGWTPIALATRRPSLGTSCWGSRRGGLCGGRHRRHARRLGSLVVTAPRRASRPAPGHVLDRRLRAIRGCSTGVEWLL
jgi:hypothetical protein